jgi:hypothetical protein
LGPPVRTPGPGHREANQPLVDLCRLRRGRAAVGQFGSVSTDPDDRVAVRDRLRGKKSEKTRRRFCASDWAMVVSHYRSSRMNTVIARIIQMSKEALTRTSVFIGHDQLENLRRRSNESGVPMAFMIRRSISLYLSGMSNQSVTGHDPGSDGRSRTSLNPWRRSHRSRLPSPLSPLTAWRPHRVFHPHLPDHLVCRPDRRRRPDVPAHFPRSWLRVP